MVVDIIIRAKNGHQMTDRCIRSIFANTPHDTFSIILVDDGSDTDLCGLDFDFYVRSSESRGAVTATNLGMGIALQRPAPYVLILDNDTEIPAGDDTWLRRMIEELEEDPRTACVGATSNIVNPPQQILSVPQTYTGDWKDEHGVGFKANPPVTHFVSFAVLFKKQVLAQLGPWDERYNPGNYEDTDVSVRVREAGYDIRVARSVYVLHHGHKTFSSDLHALLFINREKFIGKWGAGRLCDLGLLDTKELVQMIEAATP